jgi:hypothetical protein
MPQKPCSLVKQKMLEMFKKGKFTKSKPKGK